MFPSPYSHKSYHFHEPIVTVVTEFRLKTLDFSNLVWQKEHQSHKQVDNIFYLRWFRSVVVFCSQSSDSPLSFFITVFFFTIIHTVPHTHQEDMDPKTNPKSYKKCLPYLLYLRYLSKEGVFPKNVP